VHGWRELQHSNGKVATPQACGASTRGPLPRRPRGGTPARSGRQWGHNASPPRPWRIGPSGRRTPQPGPGGSGGEHASHTATPTTPSCRGRGRMDAGTGRGQGAAAPSGRSSVPQRCAAAPQGQAGQGRPQRSAALLAQGPGPPRRPNGPGRPGASRARADGPGHAYAGGGPAGRRVDASDAGGVGRAPGAPASPRARQRPAGAGSPGAARRLPAPDTWRADMTSDVKSWEPLFLGLHAVFSSSIGRAGASQRRRLILLIPVGWLPPALPPSGACPCRGSRVL
jgi:hypothetical protein